MSSLVKATLQKIKSDEAETEDGTAFAVQFNPESLKIKITNNVEGGRTTAKQTRQQTGNSSRVLSLDLHFDTVDEGSTGSPVSVREKTKQLEQFVSAEPENPDTPPKLKFQWGDLTVVGIVENLDISLDHFASNGFPLRAKVSLRIKEQDPDIQFKPGNRSSSTAIKAGGAGAIPGLGTNLSLGASFSASAALSLEGELGAEFAARVGVDPAAWRGLDVDLSAGGSLSAGIDVGFDAGLSASAGIGTATGVSAGQSVNAQAATAIGQSALTSGAQAQSASQAAMPVNSDQAGKAMSSLGGAEATINAVKIDKADTKARESSQAFGMNIAVNSAAGGQQVDSNLAISRSPLSTMSVSPGAPEPAKPQPNLPKVDTRAVSFGHGVPLQPVYPVAKDNHQQKIYASRTGTSDISTGLPPMQRGTQSPHWEALPVKDEMRDTVSMYEQNKSYNPCQTSHCGCGGKK